MAVALAVVLAAPPTCQIADFAMSPTASTCQNGTFMYYTWTDSCVGEEGFKAEGSLDGGATWHIFGGSGIQWAAGELAANTASWCEHLTRADSMYDNGLEWGHGVVRLVPWNRDGDGPPSNVAGLFAIAPDYGYTRVAATATCSSVTVSYVPQPGVEYGLYRAAAGMLSQGFSQIGICSAGTCLDSTAQPGQTYRYAVREELRGQAIVTVPTCPAPAPTPEPAAGPQADYRLYVSRKPGYLYVVRPDTLATISTTQNAVLANVEDLQSFGGHYLLAMGGISDNVSVWDVATDTPALVGTLTDHSALRRPVHAAMRGTTAFVVSATGGAGSGALTAVDLATPAAPLILGSLAVPLTLTGIPLGVAVSGDFAYLAVNGGNRPLVSVWVRDPANMRFVSAAKTDNLGEGGYPPVISGTTMAYPCDRGTLTLYDITNPLELRARAHTGWSDWMTPYFIARTATGWTVASNTGWMFGVDGDDRTLYRSQAISRFGTYLDGALGESVAYLVASSATGLPTLSRVNPATGAVLTSALLPGTGQAAIALRKIPVASTAAMFLRRTTGPGLDIWLPSDRDHFNIRRAGFSATVSAATCPAAKIGRATYRRCFYSLAAPGKDSSYEVQDCAPSQCFAWVREPALSCAPWSGAAGCATAVLKVTP